MKRTHHCNALRAQDVNKTVVLVGWIDSVRDHGGLLFLDLRDREGKTQVILNPEIGKLREVMGSLKPESVIEVHGVVKPRPESTVNKGLGTGEVEVEAREVVVHNVSQTPPFPMDDVSGDKVNEDIRLVYRYLDLRRPKNLNKLKLRHSAAKAVREYFNGNGFIEVETPMLFKSTPEGAREFLVPSRLNKGLFYALSQSPQQYKQMLMVAGVERYYSFARCFRDEDLRADRQPEFTQVDLELSFIDREDMYGLIEGVLKKVWKEVLGVDIPVPFARMAYKEAMNRYGIDKPDTRFGLELEDVTDLFKGTQFNVFATVIGKGGVIKAINAKGLADYTQGEMKQLEETAKAMGAKGLAYIRVENGEWKSPILKFLTEEEKEALKKRLKIEEGDLVLFGADRWEKACGILGKVRLDCGQMLAKRGLIEIRKDQYNFLWVVDFPLMTYDEEEGRFLATHHPFTAPVKEDIELLDSNPEAVRGQHYDVVLNGVELGGGSIRIHQPELQRKVFEEVLKIPGNIVEDRFGYMLRAFTYGAPPHGGIALGFDRMCAILAGSDSIRDVIAFPKTQRGQDLMAMSPGPVVEKQLKDLGIQQVVALGVER